MKEPYKIPAASIDKSTIERVAAISSDAGKELERIGHLLHSGQETTDDLIRLCELLFAYGEVDKSEELLRANVVEEGDAIYEAYRRLHGLSSDNVFEYSIGIFSAQFGVKLSNVNSRGFLRREYVSVPHEIPLNIDSDLARFLSTNCHIEFQYHCDGSMADVYSNEVTFPEQDYVLLKFKDGLWKKVTTH